MQHDSDIRKVTAGEPSCPTETTADGPLVVCRESHSDRYSIPPSERRAVRQSPSTNPSPYRDPISGSAAEMLEQHKLPGILFGPAQHASGYWICPDRAEEKRRQQQAFDKRYGQRVLRLAAEIKKQSLDSSDGYIVVNPCLRYTHRQKQQYLDEFEADLAALERRFGILAR